MKPRFTKEEQQYILDNYNTKKYSEIAFDLNCTATQIASWLSRNHINKSNRSIFTEDQIAYMKQHYTDMTYKEIANYLGFTERQIRGKINNMGLSKIGTYNENYFESWNAENAYWIGYIYADGYIRYNKANREYELGMELQVSDKHILEDLSEKITGTKKLTYKHFEGVIYHNKNVSITDSCVMRVHSKKIVEDLISKNIKPRKSFISDFPIIPDEFFMDFLRGYIDGDGCLYVNQKNHMTVHITSAHSEVLYYIQSMLWSHYSISTKVYKYDDMKYRIMCFRQSDCKKLLEKIYYSNDIMCLKRKKDKYLNWLPYTEMYNEKERNIGERFNLPTPRTNEITFGL